MVALAVTLMALSLQLVAFVASAGQTSSVAIHPGHTALHVTRLHRFHSSTGVKSMMEAEARFLDNNDEQCITADEAEAAKEHPAQLDALRRHQEHALRQSAESSIMELASTGRVHRSIRVLPSLLDRTSPMNTDDAGDESKEEKKQQTYDTAEDVDVLNQLESQYVGPLGIGSGPTNLFVVYDTGSTNLWVSSDLCKKGSCVKEGRVRYNHSTSKTYAKPEFGKSLKISFGTGGLTGQQAIDDLHIGPVTVKGQTFGMIETTSGDVFDNVPFEGILGLAFPKMSANGVTPFFDTAIKEKALKHNEFSFYLSKDDPAANAALWGGVDPALFEGDIEYFKVADPFFWSLDLTHFRIGDDIKFGQGAGTKSNEVKAGSFLQTANKTNAEDKVYAIVDTGTTYFSADEPLFSDIMNKVPAASCDVAKNYPDLTWRMQTAAGKTRDLTFAWNEYMLANKENNYCRPAFMKLQIPTKHGPGMIFGEVFLRKYFTVFDRRDGAEDNAFIGFAKAKQGDDVKQHLRSITKSHPSFLHDRAAKKDVEETASAEQVAPENGVNGKLKAVKATADDSAEVQ